MPSAVPSCAVRPERADLSDADLTGADRRCRPARCPRAVPTCARAVLRDAVLRDADLVRVLDKPSCAHASSSKTWTKRNRRRKP